MAHSLVTFAQVLLCPYSTHITQHKADDLSLAQSVSRRTFIVSQSTDSFVSIYAFIIHYNIPANTHKIIIIYLFIPFGLSSIPCLFDIIVHCGSAVDWIRCCFVLRFFMFFRSFVQYILRCISFVSFDSSI